MRVYHDRKGISLFRYGVIVMLYVSVFLSALWGFDTDPDHGSQLTELPIYLDKPKQLQQAMKFLPVVLEDYSHDNMTYHSSDFFGALNMFHLRTNCEANERVERVLSPKGILNTPSVVLLSPPTELPPLFNDAENMMEQLKNLTSATMGRLSTRRWDLYKKPRSVSVVQPSYPWRKFYIALNLWKNEDVIPYFTAALVAFIEEEIAPFFSVADDVVISIYSNDSPDETALLIEEVLIPRLQTAGVRKIYATTSGSCLGYYSRQSFHHRIEWLSCVRNKAMEPLYELGMNLFLPDPLRSSTAKGSKLDEDDLVVIFFNDIFFHPKDITRLLETRPERVMASETPLHGEVSDLSGETKLNSLRHPEIKGFDMACGMDFFYRFYDTWVSKDVTGGSFLPLPPYSDNPAIQRAFLSSLSNDPAKRSMGDGEMNNTVYEEGVAVKSCWNGVAAIRGRFFLPPSKEVVKFRMDQFAGRSEEEVRQLSLVEDLPVVLKMGHDFYYSKTDGSKSVARLEERQHVLPLTRCYDKYDTLPRVVSRPSGAIYELVEDNLKEIDEDPFDELWMHTWALRLGYRWQMVVLNRMRRGKLFCEVSPDADLCFLGPEFLMKVLKGSSEQTMNEEVIQFKRRATDDITLALQGNPTYQAVYPSLIFRSAVVPSYGAQVSRRFMVAPSVCKSSECLLVAEDIMQLTYIQERRSPIILMNPNIRVTYEWKHFTAVQGSMFKSSWFFSSCLYASRIIGWILFFLGVDVDQSWRNDNHFRDGEDSMLRSIQSTSVRDDWMIKDISGGLDIIYSSLQRKWVYVNLTTMSMMHCDVAGSYILDVGYILSRLVLRLSILVFAVLGLLSLLKRAAWRFCWLPKHRRTGHAPPRYVLP